MAKPIAMGQIGARTRYRLTAVSAKAFISRIFPKPSKKEIKPTIIVNHPKKKFFRLIKIPMPIIHTLQTMVSNKFHIPFPTIKEKDSNNNLMVSCCSGDERGNFVRKDGQVAASIDAPIAPAKT